LNITILNVSVTTVPTAKGSYQVADVAFKNNSFGGKVEGKKIMSFGAGKEAFGVLSAAQPGAVFEVTTNKNDKGYIDWVSLVPAQAGIAPAAAPQQRQVSTQTGATRSNFETPEERAQRQVSIVRQSSLSNAVATLSVGAKKLEADDVIALAKRYEAFVHGKDAGPTGFDDLPDFPKEIFESPQVS
jgi:hypothetical protein